MHVPESQPHAQEASSLAGRRAIAARSVCCFSPMELHCMHASKPAGACREQAGHALQHHVVLALAVRAPEEHVFVMRARGHHRAVWAELDREDLPSVPGQQHGRRQKRRRPRWALRCRIPGSRKKTNQLHDRRQQQVSVLSPAVFALTFFQYLTKRVYSCGCTQLPSSGGTKAPCAVPNSEPGACACSALRQLGSAGKLALS